MQIADLYPYWERERDQLFDGLGQIVKTLRTVRPAEEVEQIFHWVPPGGRRSISDTLRHMQTLPLGLARFLSYQEDTTGALYAFCIMQVLPRMQLEADVDA